MKTILLLSIILTATRLFSQSVDSLIIENELLNSYNQILFHRFGSEIIDFDSIEIGNEHFRNKMEENICGNSNSISYHFDSLKQKIHIVSSDDKRLRIYGWNTCLGGTMEDYESLYQYQFGDSVFTKRINNPLLPHEEDYYGFYSQLFTLNTDNKTYYLAIENGKYSSKDLSQNIRVITIENNLINDTISLFKTSDGFVNSIGIYFDFFSVVNRPERPLRLIKYNERKKRLYIPIVNKKQEVTNRFDRYRFTGQYFEKIGVKGKKT